MKKHERLHDIVLRFLNDAYNARKVTTGEDRIYNDAQLDAHSNMLIIIESLWDMPETCFEEEE